MVTLPAFAVSGRIRLCFLCLHNRSCGRLKHFIRISGRTAGTFRNISRRPGRRCLRCRRIYGRSDLPEGNRQRPTRRCSAERRGHEPDSRSNYGTGDERTDRPRMGNRDDIMAPHGCYPCKGEEQMGCHCRGHRRRMHAMRKVMGNPDCAKMKNLSTSTALEEIRMN